MHPLKDRTSRENSDAAPTTASMSSECDLSYVHDARKIEKKGFRTLPPTSLQPFSRSLLALEDRSG